MHIILYTNCNIIKNKIQKNQLILVKKISLVDIKLTLTIAFLDDLMYLHFLYIVVRKQTFFAS